MGGDGRRRLPPGFRFRPTDEELLTHYLAPKAADAGFAPAAVREADLYGAEPWDLLRPAGGAGAGGYFFCRRSVKFPSGLTSNRATRAGYWKSTGKDKVVPRQHPAARRRRRPSASWGEEDARVLPGTRAQWRQDQLGHARVPAGARTWRVHRTRPRCLRQELRVFMRKPPGETSSLMETPVAVAAASDHANCFSGALATAPAGDHLEMTCGQGVLQLNHENHDQELPINNDGSASGRASAATTAVSSEPMRRQASLLWDELSSDTFDLLPQLLDYEGFPVLQDF